MKSKLPTPPFAKNKCNISDDWEYKGMKTIWMENDFVRIGILADRGSDIFEFTYKLLDIDFMLHLPKGIRNPQKDFSQMRDTRNQFEDYYYGGWQEILPNTPSFNYRGASLGQHGEVSLTPWKYAIIEKSPEKVSVKLWTVPLRVPVKIEKTLSILFDQPTLFIEEKLTNETKTNLEIVWGHHIAFGLPFLNEGVKIETNAKKIISEVTMPDHRRFKPGIESNWPMCKNISDKDDDASIIPSATDPPYSDLSYLYDFDDDDYGNYSIINTNKNIGLNVKWDAKLFKYLWYWQERYATQDAPWWGNAYAVALEPWTSMYRPDAEEAIKKGEWLSIKPNDFVETKLSASVVII